jgi:hypothetical protein
MSGEKYLELASVAGVEGIRYLGFLPIFLFLFLGLEFVSTFKSVPDPAYYLKADPDS